MGNGIGAICNETHPTGLVFFCVIHMSFLSWNISGWFRILPSIFRSLSGFVDHRIVTRVMHPWCQDAKYTGTVSWFSVGRMGFRWSDMFDNILSHVDIVVPRQSMNLRQSRLQIKDRLNASK